MGMITVFGAPPTRAMRVVWMLEEMGLDYEVRPVDFANRFKDKEFLALSPAGFMPGLRDGDVGMFESAAIIDYLGQKYGPTPLCPAKDDPRWPKYLQYLHFGEASLTAPMNVTMASRMMAPEGEKDNFGARIAVDICVQRSRALVKQLERTPYMVGADFTAADISVSYFLGFAEMFDFKDKLDPLILDYHERLKARPAYQRAAAKRVQAAV
jgi:glutathione S-transferase